MLGFFITSVVSFISTNIDNIFVMMLLYAKVDASFKKRYIVIGQYLGIGALVAVSILGAFGLTFLPQKYVGLLGIIPILLGIKEWVSYRKRKEGAKPNHEPAPAKGNAFSNILNVTIVAVANGADNIGVYIPLFSAYSTKEITITIFIFAFMMALWCFLGDKIVDFPGIKRILQKYRHKIVPVLFIGLGVYIIIKNVFVSI